MKRKNRPAKGLWIFSKKSKTMWTVMGCVAAGAALTRIFFGQEKAAEILRLVEDRVKKFSQQVTEGIDAAAAGSYNKI